MKGMKPMEPMKPMKPMDFGERWWPADLGKPSSAGSQDDLRYAFFPDKHRLLVEEGGKRTTYDSGDHAINGVSQQASGGRSVAFSTSNGQVRLQDLKVMN